MRVLVTGGHGYVGGRIAHHLIQSGYKVTLGSRQVGGRAEWLPQADIANLDWGNQAALEKACKSMDVVIHAAGMNAQDCHKQPIDALEFNGVASSRLAVAATTVGVDKFVYFSTAHVYSNPLQGFINEEVCPKNLDPYATSHLAGEYAIRNIWGPKKNTPIILRLSNAIGAPMHKNVNCWMLLVNDLCLQAVQNKNLILRTLGLQKRDFITLNDVSMAVEHLLKIDISSKENGIFNIGSCLSITIFEMAHLIASRCEVLFGFRPKITRPEGRITKINTEESIFIYDNKKLLSTGFNLGINFNREIDETLKMCARQNLR